MTSILPWLLAMMALAAVSAFFSASEAALFSLRASDRRSMAGGTAGERTAVMLLRDPERLLSAVLFWNLVINVTFFALSAIVMIRLRNDPETSSSTPPLLALGSLLLLIFCGEMVPKSVGVTQARWYSRKCAIPLSLAIRSVELLLPGMRFVMLMSQRLLFPRFDRETDLEVDDLHRAIEVSTDDDQLIRQEQTVLRNIVELSTIRVDEWMRPRSQFESFRPPVSLEALTQRMPDSEYALITEPDSDEIASAIHLPSLTELREDHLEFLAEPVMYVPWCTTVADALERMSRKDREVAAIVNEFGMTIGVITFEDVLDTLFSYAPSRSKLIFDQNPVHVIAKGKWLVSGMTSLKRLTRDLEVPLPETRNVTISGIIQESLQRLAEEGDECDWGPLHLRVVEMPNRGFMLVELTYRRGGENTA